VFVADDLGAWLVGLLAEGGRRRLTAAILGSDQERALRQAATAAVRLTAAEVRPDSDEQADHLAAVISEVFARPMPDAPLSGRATLLEAVQAGIDRQVAVLGDADLTGTAQSSADVLGVSPRVLAEKLTSHLLREIVGRGSGGGPLFPLASQLNDDVTHLQGQQMHGALRQLGGEIREALARLDGARVTAAAPTAPVQLPPAIMGFSGRDDDLAALAELLDPAGITGPVVVSAVAGLPGVGKTTLAVQAGHLALRRGWYRGGVLFINLRGYDEEPVGPAQALDALLRALGVPAEHIPPDTETRASMYRSALAQASEPVLVIADNASSEAQVRSLLPGTGPHRLIATSRHTLGGLEARLLDVTVLDDAASVGLLDAALRAARPSDERIKSDPESAVRLARICGGLPLALQIVAAALKSDPARSTADMAEDLTVEQERLARLRYDDGSGVAAPSVAVAFEMSYRRLDETSARTLRLLPIDPGPDLSTAAAAVLADLPAGRTRDVLAGLAKAHLIEPSPGQAARWRMHDLMRLYAQRLSDNHADEDHREAVRDRLLHYYLDIAHAADEHLRALPGMTVPKTFADRPGALAWLDANHPNLVAVVTVAADNGQDQVALHLPLTLAEYLSWRNRTDDWLATMTISVAAARRLGDRAGEARALTIFGLVLRHAQRFDEAISACHDAAAICQEIGDRHGEGRALNIAGLALVRAGRFEEAISACQHAAPIFRETGDRHGEGMALNNLGTTLQEIGRFDEAITAHQGAMAIYRETGDRHREGRALNFLGNDLRLAGRLEEAIAACQGAATVLRETGDRQDEARALTGLASALQDIGRFGEASAACQEAAAIFGEIGDRRREEIALDKLKRIGAAQNGLN
jgi:tetratricopeptide (TPR) repeat protein